MSSNECMLADVKKRIEILLKNEKITKYAVRDCNSLTEHIPYVSKILFVDVELENLNEVTKLHYFVKVAKRETECREIIDIKKKYKTETFVYEYMIPQFVKFQRQKNISSQLITYPHYYTSTNEDCREMIILDNLLEKGLKISTTLMTLDYDHSLVVIRELAKFHAISFAIRDQNPLIFQEISKNVSDVEFHGKQGEMMKTYLEKFFPMYIDTLRLGNHTDIADKLIQVKDTISDTAKMLVEDESAEPYTVINHGDVWINNMLFRYSESGRPTDVCLVDFQATKRCSPVSDISQLIFTSVSTETRNAHYEDLIREYYNHFSGFLLELGSDPQELFPYHILQSHLKKYSLLGLTLSMKLISGTSICSEEFPKYENVADINTVSEIFYNAKRNTDLFNKKITALILDYFKFGYDL